MTPDERLEFLRQSTESLHASCQELSAQMARQSEHMAALDARERQAREALLSGIAAYLRALGSGNGQAPEE